MHGKLLLVKVWLKGGTCLQIIDYKTKIPQNKGSQITYVRSLAKHKTYSYLRMHRDLSTVHKNIQPLPGIEPGTLSV